MLDLKTIQHFIPHRPPFLFLDQITACTPFESITSTFTLLPDAWYFTGHFPHNPVFPGVLSLEVIAQTATFLATYSLQQPWEQKNIYLMSIDKAKFRNMAKPGDILTCHTKVERRKEPICKMYGEIHVDQTLICSAHLMAVMAE